MRTIDLISQDRVIVADNLLSAIGALHYMSGPFDSRNFTEFYFRSQNSVDFDLRPRLMRRRNPLIDEMYAIRMIFQRHETEFAEDKYMIDRLSRLRHLEFPTRLLDITSNPLVALYFALYGKNTSDGVVYTLGFFEDSLKTRDSDSLSILANFSLLSNKDQNRIIEMVNSEHWDRISWAAACDPIVQIIQRERPYFKNMIDTETFVKNFVVDATITHDRIRAQSGSFIMFGPASPFEIDTSSLVLAHVTKAVVIPKEKKSEIMYGLVNLGISKRTLFPEIGSTIEFINRSLSTEHVSTDDFVYG